MIADFYFVFFVRNLYLSISGFMQGRVSTIISKWLTGSIFFYAYV